MREGVTRVGPPEGTRAPITAAPRPSWELSPDQRCGRLASLEKCASSFRQTSVYPREVVRAALGLNAAAVILAHNHPSGHAEPSRADEVLTQTLKSALALVDVRVLDHFVVAADTVTSFAERGLL